MPQERLSLEALLNLIDSTQQADACMAILQDCRQLFQKAKGSSHNHQAWAGGYWDHVVEAMNIAVVTYRVWNECRPLDFSLSEALVILFIHDIEKPWKYMMGPSGELIDDPTLADKVARKAFREEKLAEYRLVLNARQRNALNTVEGEFGSYSNTRRAQWPLGAFCHMCDNTSARMWPEYPRNSGDDWALDGRIVDSDACDNVVCQQCGSAEVPEVRVGNPLGKPHAYCKVCGGQIK